MLFDEPTSALDPEMIKEVLDVMVDLAKRRHDDDRRHPRDGLRPHRRRPGACSCPTAQIVEENTPEEFFTNPQTDRAKDFLGKILKH